MAVDGGEVPASLEDEVFNRGARGFETKRKVCHGKWTISRDTVKLIAGSCPEEPLPPPSQRLLTNATLALGSFYMPLLMEHLGPFATRYYVEGSRRSPWEWPTWTVSVAAMVWSRAVAQSSQAGLGPQPTIGFKFLNKTVQDEIYYQLMDNVVSRKPTLKRSYWLYIVLAIQPLLTMVMLILSIAL